MSQVKGFSPVWFILCAFNWWGHVKDWLHISHLKGFSTVWVFLWAFKYLAFLKALLHMSQVKSFSPVWVLICTSTCSARVKALSHTSQLWGLCSASNFTTAPFSRSEFLSNVTSSVFWPKSSYPLIHFSSLSGSCFICILDIGFIFPWRDNPH